MQKNSVKFLKLTCLKRAICPSATSRAAAASASRIPNGTSSNESPAALKAAKASPETKPTTAT